MITREALALIVRGMSPWARDLMTAHPDLPYETLLEIAVGNITCFTPMERILSS